MKKLFHAGWFRSVVALSLVVVILAGINCATILDGSKRKSERTSRIQWGFFVMDILLTDGIGLIVDFCTGAIYEAKPGKVSLEERPIHVCPTAAAEARKHSKDTIDSFGAFFKDHVAGCKECRTALAR